MTYIFSFPTQLIITKIASFPSTHNPSYSLPTLFLSYYNSSTPSSMAPKRNMQQSLDAPDAKRNGKKPAIEDNAEKSKEEDLAISQTVAVTKDVPESSNKKDSSSESETEDDEEALDVWEREARKLYVPKADDKWRPWSPREEMIIFVGAYHARAVLKAQLAAEQQVTTEQGTEDKETAQMQVDEEQNMDDADADQDADVSTVPDVPVATNDQPANADAQDTDADFSPVPPPTNN